MISSLKSSFHRTWILWIFSTFMWSINGHMEKRVEGTIHGK